MDVAIPSTGLLLGIAGIFIVVIATIFGLKALYKTRDAEKLRASMDNDNPLKARNKYPGVDVFRYSGSFLSAGLVLALLVSILAFNWTTYDDAIFIPDDAMELDEEIEVEPPRTAEPPPPPPPPPPPVIEEVPEELMEEEDEPEFIDQSVEVEDVVEAPPPVEEVKDVPPPPPPPPPPAPKVEEIFKVVEQMPMFPGCESSGGSNEELQQCATKKMLEYIYGNIKYPAIARENGVEGTAVVTFVVEKDGTITDARIVRDPGAQTGGEALRVVETFPKWVPGKQRGNSVRVQFNLPVKFRLE